MARMTKPQKHATYCGTRNLYEPMVWASKGLLANSSVDVIHLLIEDDEFPFELPDCFEVMNVKEYVDATFPDGSANAKTHFTKMAMARCCYPVLLEDVDLILQLDPDTVVVDDIDAIWDTDMTGKWFAAVHECLSGYDPFNSGHYYNVGVCLFNLAQMGEDNVQRDLVQFLNTRRTVCIEQDALNYLGATQGKATDLDMRFNENRACGFTDDPAIVHYVGHLDWETNIALPRREYLKLYRDKSWDEIMKLHEQHKRKAR